MEYLQKRGVQLAWVGAPPERSDRVALLVPQYNESSNCIFEKRLHYFYDLAQEYKDHVDVILIDDGSTDGSLGKIKRFQRQFPALFYVASVSPNANKVGALYLTAKAIDHQFVVLSDFDTDIAHLWHLLAFMPTIEQDSEMMGCFFRMLPYEGQGYVFTFQQMEYSLARCIYRFHEREKSIRVMPGAGACYKREVLLAIYGQHSGLRSGEDREATAIGMRLGYKTFYLRGVLALTRPPLSMKNLVRQRVRWNLGYIETFFKERKYYFRQMMRGNRIGIMTMMDVIAAAFLLLSPLLFAVLLLLNIKFFLFATIFLYAGHLAWCLNQIRRTPDEFREFGKWRMASVLYYPVMKIVVGYFAWTGSFIRFLKLNLRRKKTQDPAVQVHEAPVVSLAQAEQTPIDK